MSPHRAARRHGMRTPAVVLAVAGAALLGLAPHRALAQIRGVVTDGAGQPLPGVLVELWDAHRRLGADGTDRSGYFRLAAAASGPRALLARGIGLEPLRHTLAPGDSVVRLVMRPLAVEVSAVTVEARPTECPERDDPRARALWEHAAAHYDVALSASGVRTDVQLLSALVPVESLGVIDTMRLQAWAVQGGYSPLAFATRLATQRNFYAVPASRIPWRRYGRWHYPLLESSRAWHFADSLFAVMNRIAFAETSEGDTVIAFCSSFQNRPYIRGRLRLAPDTTLASAEWDFVTPSPREEAGGQVLFAPADSRLTGQPLLPVAGLFWRRLLQKVYQEWMEYRQWFRCESAVSCSAPTPLR
jgi:hypothetical protein